MNVHETRTERLINEVMQASPPMRNPQGHRRYLETLRPSELEARRDALLLERGGNWARAGHLIGAHD